MEGAIEGVSSLFQTLKGKAADRIEKLPQSGSDRTYFRIYSDTETFIATYNQNIQENRTFINFSMHFRQRDLPVPEILEVGHDIIPLPYMLQQKIEGEEAINHPDRLKILQKLIH